MSLDQFRPKAYVRGDSSLLLLVIGVCLFGLLMISSSSVVISYDQFGKNNVYLTKQAIYLLLGCVGLIITSIIDYKLWKKYARIILIIALGLMILVEIPGIGLNLGGAKRWINLGPILLQPSEIMKLAFIIYTASWLEKKGTQIKNFKKGVLPYILLVGFITILIVKQPDLGTALVIAASGGVMLYVAGVRYTHLSIMGFGGLSLVYLLIRSSQYRWERLLTFLNPKADLQGAGYQINQALLAIGSGGWLGRGFGMSRQKYLYLPQAQTDAIFAVMVEELGFLRVIILIAIYVLIGLKGLAVAKNAPDQFSRFLATGIVTWILFQAFVNMAGVMGILPLTGIPLPFVSYGGSSLLALLAGVGILYNISRHARHNDIQRVQTK